METQWTRQKMEGIHSVAPYQTIMYWLLAIGYFSNVVMQ